ARRDEQADQQTEEAVDPLAADDVRRQDAMARGQGGPEIVEFGIAVFPRLRRRFGHCRDGAGRGTEGALVGAEPGAERAAEPALAHLGADEGNRLRQTRDQLRVAGHQQAPGRDGRCMDDVALRHTTVAAPRAMDLRMAQRSARRASAARRIAISSSVASSRARASSTTSSGARAMKASLPSLPLRPFASFSSLAMALARRARSASISMTSAIG